MKKALTLLFSFILFLSCQYPEADLIIHNAKIYTINKKFDIATAVAVSYTHLTLPTICSV